MRNRLSQHLAAIGIAGQLLESNSSPEPLVGEAHYRIAEYSPGEVSPKWKPKDVGDSLIDLERKQIKYGRCHRDLSAALREVLTFNARMLADTLTRWATVAWIDCGTPKITLAWCRVVLPLRFVVRDVVVPEGWEPRTLLDAPTWQWADEISPHYVRRDLDSAALFAAKKNRGFKDRKRNGIGRRWFVVLAIEAEPTTAHVAIDGGGGKGILSLHSVRRFHVADCSWPISPAVLSGLGGGI